MEGNRIYPTEMKQNYPSFGALVKSVVISASFPDTMHSADALVQALRLAAGEGFYDTVEFFLEDGERPAFARIRKELDRFAKPSVFLAGAHLKSRRLNLGSLNDGHRRHAISETKRLIDQAYFFGSSLMLITSGQTLDSEEERNASFALLAESLKELCDYAERRAEGQVLQITLEFFNDHGEPHFLVGPTPAAQKLAEVLAADYGNFGITFDLSHVIQLGENPAVSLERLAPYVRHVHLANCYLKDALHPLYGDKHPPFDLEDGEMGREDVFAFLLELERQGFFGRREAWTMGIEVIPPSSADAHDIYRKTTSLYKGLWERLQQRQREQLWKEAER